MLEFGSTLESIKQASGRKPYKPSRVFIWGFSCPISLGGLSYLRLIGYLYKPFSRYIKIDVIYPITSP